MSESRRIALCSLRYSKPLVAEVVECCIRCVNKGVGKVLTTVVIENLLTERPGNHPRLGKACTDALVTGIQLEF